MTTRWTPQQQAAIDTRGRTLLVSAGAGSGKTAVLSQRALNRMMTDTPPVPADRLLLLTFTRAAAAEMKERIRGKLLDFLEENPAHPLAQQQLSLLERAQIGTIHRLCVGILRENSQAAGLPPDFRIGEEEEMGLLRELAIGQALEARYAAENPVFLALVELFGDKRGDQSLVEAVLELLEYARANAFYRDWLHERLSLYRSFPGPGQSIWGKILLQQSKERVEQWIEIAWQALEEIDATPDLLPYRAVFEADRATGKTLQDRILAGCWDDAYAFCQAHSFPRMPAPRKIDPELREEMKRRRGLVKDCFEDLRDKIFIADEAGFLQDVELLLPLLDCLFSLVEEVDDRILAQKLQKGLLDFSDLEQMTLRLLVEKKGNEIVKTPLAQRLASCYDEVMADEYQDVNAAQDMLLWALSQTDNRFMVGDVKQSIYRFRQAMPEIFTQKLHGFLDLEVAGAGEPARILLNASFRSRVELTQRINRIFEAVMSQAVGEIAYDHSQALNPQAQYPPSSQPPMALFLVAPDEGDQRTSAQREAAFVAQKIKELVEHGEAMPQEIAILLRSPKQKGEIFRRALQQAGIAASVTGSGGLLDSAEICAVTNLLAALVNPTREVELVGALLSPIFALHTEDLARLRLDWPQGRLYAGLLRTENPRLQQALAQLKHFRQLARVLPPAALLGRLYLETGFDMICRAMQGGEQRQANLQLLVELARKSQGTGFRSLASFVAMLDRMREQNKSPEPPPTGDVAKSVTITSIHKSKGLEWKVVFLSDAGRRHSFYQNDLTAPFILHNQLGFACMRREEASKRQFVTLPLAAVRAVSQRALASEELRVLYVALTRAKERLVITATSKKPEQLLAALPQPQEGQLSTATCAGAISHLEWVLLGLSQNPGLFPVDVVDQVEQKNELTFGQLAQPERQPPDLALQAELGERLRYAYPQRQVCALPAKMAASRFVNAHSHGFFDKKPALAGGQAAQGARRGSAMHAFLQHCTLQEPVEKQIAQLVQAGRLTAEQAALLRPQALEQFMQSALAQRMRSAKTLLREHRFLASAADCPMAKTLTVGIEGTMLEGIADCLLLFDGEAELVDFKTDFIQDPADLIERYSNQLFLYREMLASSLALPVTRCTLYSLSLNCEISV